MTKSGILSIGELQAPFPYFGGKSTIAHEVWARLGDVKNYVEPFFGSGAVFLKRPPSCHSNLYETVNDFDGLLCNFWRAIKLSPVETAAYAEYPKSELDLHARNKWLIGQRESITEKLRDDPEWHDAKAAGWWVWGISSWIGNGWGYLHERKKPDNNNGGIFSNQFSNMLPEKFQQLSLRFSNTKVLCGDWKRPTSYTWLDNNGLTGVFLDPHYVTYGKRLYIDCDSNLNQEITQFCLEHGENPKIRIALCGFKDEYQLPPSWEVFIWKRQGGLANQAKRFNCIMERDDECIWFSPHCLKANQMLLWD